MESEITVDEKERTLVLFPTSKLWGVGLEDIERVESNLEEVEPRDHETGIYKQRYVALSISIVFKSVEAVKRFEAARGVVNAV